MAVSFVILLAAAAVTWGLLFPVRGLLRRRGVVDWPNGRSSHCSPTIRGGGITIIFVLLLAGGVAAVEERLLGLLVGAAAVLGGVSFVDDTRGVPARVRFAVHALSAAVSLVAVQLLTDYGVPLSLAWWVYPVAWLWIAGYTNAFNFMDGINGIAGMQALTAGIGTALVGTFVGLGSDHAAVLAAAVIAGSALGFLPHNFPRARVFMGDVSSATLGFLLATLAVWIAAEAGLWLLFWIGLLHANFVLDTGITLVRRALRGDRLSEAHREHFYQRLVRAGQSHTRVTLTQFGLQVLVGCAIVWATPQSPAARWAIGAGVVVLWLVYFAWAEAVFRRAAPGKS